MKRWIRVAMLLCSVLIPVSAAHAVQQSDGKAMLERLAAKTKAEVARLEQAEKKNAGKTKAAVDGRQDELPPEQLVGDSKTSAVIGSMIGQQGSCSEIAAQHAGKIEKIRQELRQKKLLLRKTEAKLARLNQSAQQRAGQRVPSSQMVAAAEGDTGSISGTVKDTAGSPVAGVYVYVYTSDYTTAGYGYTGADGNYTVSGLPSGSYKVEFDASYADGNYISEWHSDKSSFESADLVQVTTPNAATVNAELATGGSISGKVTNAAGDPLENVYVIVYTAYSGGCYYYQYAGSASTGTDGNYTVSGLPSGSYKVEFDASYADGSYISEWNSDKDSFETADLVQVTAPNAVTGINASLASAGSISGKVTDVDGTPVADVAVRVYTSTYNSAGYGNTGADGSYTVSGLPSGSYKVEFDASNADGNYISEWHSDKSSFDAADMVQVTAPNAVTGINASLATAGSISGTVTDVDGTPVAGVSVYVHTSTNHYSFEYAGSDYTGADGNYTVSGLPSGSYKVEFDASNADGNYISEWHSDKSSFDAADMVQVSAPNAVNVNAELAAGGSISGKVTDEAGNPIVGSCWSYPYIAVQNSSTGDTIAETMVSSDGTYVIKGLPAGSYKVLFSASWLGYIPQWYNGKADFDSSDAVNVASNSVVENINAVMKIGGSISGKVMDADGKPVAGIWVSSSKSSVFGTQALARTDANGNYTLKGLPTGSYKVHFEADRTVYADEWYNNKRSFSAADPVTVTAPNTIADIDAALDPASPASPAVKAIINTLLLRRK